LVIEIIGRHASGIGPDDVKIRASKDGHFIAVTVTIEATSKRQLDAIYQDLSNHPLVLVAL